MLDSINEQVIIKIKINFVLESHFIKELPPWLMQPGSLMPHLQGLLINPYPEANQSNSPH